jgi:hypothetical protein
MGPEGNNLAPFRPARLHPSYIRAIQRHAPVQQPLVHRRHKLHPQFPRPGHLLGSAGVYRRSTATFMSISQFSRAIGIAACPSTSSAVRSNGLPELEVAHALSQNLSVQPVQREHRSTRQDPHRTSARSIRITDASQLQAEPPSRSPDSCPTRGASASPPVAHEGRAAPWHHTPRPKQSAHP